MITDFLNKPLTDELINRIAEQCTLKGMRENEISFIVSPEEEFSVTTKGRGRRLEELLHSWAEW